jgi:hypothetical protein
METTNEIPIISVPIEHYRQNDILTEEEVDFKIYRTENRFRAIPLLSKEERLPTGLPEELRFVYAVHCISDANDMEEESLNAIKKIIQELEVKELL